MGQITLPRNESLILSPVDRLVASNAGSGLAVAAQHVILLGEDAGMNMGAIDGAIVLGHDSARNVPASANGLIVLGQGSGNGVVPPGTVVIGNASLNGPLATAGAADWLVLGNRNLSVMATQASTTYPVIALGSDNLPNKTTTNLDGAILIGNEIMFTDNRAGTAINAILIGNGIMRNATNAGVTGIGNSLFIGNDIYRNVIAGGAYGNSIVIGHANMDTAAGAGWNAAAVTIVGTNNDVSSAATLADFSSSVLLGSSNEVISGGLASARTQTITIGNGNRINGTNNFTIGYNNQLPLAPSTGNLIVGIGNTLLTSTFNNCTLIGNSHTDATTGGMLLAGNYFAVAPSPTSWLIWGRSTSGNIVLGNSSAAQKDLEAIGCTNALKIVAGTRGAGNPLTGGFFYYETGVGLHFVGDAGTDTVIAPA